MPRHCRSLRILRISSRSAQLAGGLVVIQTPSQRLAAGVGAMPWSGVRGRYPYEKTAASFLGVLCSAASIDWIKRGAALVPRMNGVQARNAELRMIGADRSHSPERGGIEEARAAASRKLELEPTFTITNWTRRSGFTSAQARR